MNRTNGIAGQNDFEFAKCLQIISGIEETKEQGKLHLEWYFTLKSKQTYMAIIDPQIIPIKFGPNTGCTSKPGGGGGGLP